MALLGSRNTQHVVCPGLRTPSLPHQVSLALHAFLRSLSDLMPHLPAYSPVLRLAVRAWALPFTASDHAFLHSSQVFSRLSRLLHAEGGPAPCTEGLEASDAEVRTGVLDDVTASAQLRLSSNEMFAKILTGGTSLFLSLFLLLHFLCF